jgi:hypothetical protein
MTAAEVVITRSMGKGRNMFLVPACTVGSFSRMHVVNAQYSKNKQSNKVVPHKIGMRRLYSVEEWVGWVPWLMVSNNPKAFIALKQRF